MRTLIVTLSLLAFISAPAVAEEEPPSYFPFSLSLNLAPTYYEYKETGKKEFSGFKTDWEAFAVLAQIEGRYATPWPLTTILRVSTLTSVEAKETNNQNQASSDMRVGYFVNLQPGVQWTFQPSPSFAITPEFSWDLDWYQQTRDTSFAGNVDEDVFWHGPSIGGEATFVASDNWVIAVVYRHSFLIDVTAKNDAFDDFGYDEFSTDGQRDIVEASALWNLSQRWALRFGMRFESARIAASDTEFGFSTFVQFPENDHLLISPTVGAVFRF